MLSFSPVPTSSDGISMSSPLLMSAIFCLFVFFLSCFLSHRSQSTWVSGVNTWFRFYSFFAMLTSWLLSVHLLFFIPPNPYPSPPCPPSPLPWMHNNHFLFTLDWRNTCMLLWHLDRLFSPWSGDPNWLKLPHIFFYKKSVLVIRVGHFMFILMILTSVYCTKNQISQSFVCKKQQNFAGVK